MIGATRFRLGIVFLLLSACDKPSDITTGTTVRVVAISNLPDPQTIPYPHTAAVCHCRDKTGTELLVALPAIRDRKKIAEFRRIKVGSEILIPLIPWDERPPPVRAMFIANDFKDLYDLPLYFAPSFDFP